MTKDTFCKPCDGRGYRDGGFHRDAAGFLVFNENIRSVCIDCKGKGVKK